jgi:hypothetical protein
LLTLYTKVKSYKNSVILMKSKTIFLALIVLFQIVDANAQFQIKNYPNRPVYSKEPKADTTYRMLYEDPKTGKIYPDSALVLNWNKNLAKWDTVRFEIFTYNQDNYTTCKVEKVLDSTRINFINRTKTDYAYNKWGKCDVQISQSFNSNGWKNSSRIVRIFDVTGNCTEELYQRFDTSGWVNNTRNIWEFDSHGNKIKEYMQGWEYYMFEWATITWTQNWDITYEGNKIIRAQYGSYGYPGNSGTEQYDYKCIYKKGESNPSEVVFDYSKRSLNWGNDYYTNIYKDVVWNNGFSVEKLFSIEDEADYIRQDSSFYTPSNLHNGKMRKSFYKNGLIVQDSVFFWNNNHWVKTRAKHWDYNIDRKTTMVISKILHNDFQWDTESTYQFEYDYKGNKILDFQTNFYSDIKKSGSRYTYVYKDASDDIVSVTKELFNRNIDSFEFTTRVIYFPSQQHKEPKESPPVKTVFIYPNPCSSYINIIMKSENDYQSASYQILDISGKVVKLNQFKQFYDISEIVDISNLNSGLYFLVLTLDNSKQYLKLIKQ